MHRGRVIIVDDDRQVRRALQRLLRVAGYEVEALEDAAAYLSHGPVEPPACMLLDLRMPGMSGLELLRAISGTPSALPVVLISGHADELTRSEALAAGATEMLEKPIDEAWLLQAVEQALAQAARPGH
jgi:FixJ family two-component response regulator